MPEILHITTRLAWEHAQVEGEYRGDTLATEGFIHFCEPGKVAGVCERCFRGRTGLVVLRVEPGSLTSPLRWESPPGSAEVFPHVYGPLNLASVVDVVPLEDVLAK